MNLATLSAAGIWYGFVAICVIVLIFGRLNWLQGVGLDAELVIVLGINFSGIVLEAMPFVMIGSMLAGLIEVFLSRAQIANLLPKRRGVAIFAAGLLGLIFPVCECAVIAVTRRLVRKGVPFSVAIAYLLAGPIVNPVVGFSTYVAFDESLSIVFIRLGVGFLVAVIAAIIMDRLFPKHDALLATPGTPPSESTCCGSDTCESASCETDNTKDEFTSRLWMACNYAARDFLDIGRYLIVGAFVAAFARTLISEPAFLALADNVAVASLLMMGLAILLNLCSEADAFVAASFAGVLPFSALMAFLVLGPMLDLKLIAMYLTFVKKRAIAVLAVLLCAFVFAAVMLIQWLTGGAFDATVSY